MSPGGVVGLVCFTFHLLFPGSGGMSPGGVVGLVFGLMFLVMAAVVVAVFVMRRQGTPIPLIGTEILFFEI